MSGKRSPSPAEDDLIPPGQHPGKSGPGMEGSSRREPKDAGKPSKKLKRGRVRPGFSLFGNLPPRSSFHYSLPGGSAAAAAEGVGGREFRKIPSKASYWPIVDWHSRPATDHFEPRRLF